MDIFLAIMARENVFGLGRFTARNFDLQIEVVFLSQMLFKLYSPHFLFYPIQKMKIGKSTRFIRSLLQFEQFGVQFFKSLLQF